MAPLRPRAVRMVRTDDNVEPVGSAVVLPVELLCWCCAFAWCWDGFTAPSTVYVLRSNDVPTATVARHGVDGGSSN